MQVIARRLYGSPPHVAKLNRVWTPVELIRWTDRYLGDRGFERSRLDAELLLAGVLGLKRLDLYLQFDRPLAAEELAEFKDRLKRRLRHEPLQYIAGTAAFRDLEVGVDRRVLIPRPETELLVDAVLAWTDGRNGLDVVDVGTGSGAIALALRTEGEFGRIVATDVSSDALALARENADRSGMGEMIDFRLGSLYDPLHGDRFDAIVSNPPYVAERDRVTLDAEVADWEPASALFAGADGLDVIRPLVAGAGRHLCGGGLLALEIGADQAEAVMALIRSTAEFMEPRVEKDLCGRNRVVLAERRARDAESDAMQRR